MFCFYTFISKRPGILAPPVEKRTPLKAGRREIPGSISGWLVDFVVPSFPFFLFCFFSENRVKTGQDPLQRPPLPTHTHGGYSSYSPRILELSVGFALKIQPKLVFKFFQ